MLIVNSRWAISIDKPKLNFMPMIWEEECIVKNIKNGEERVKEAQWTHIGDYYPNVAQALRGIMKYEERELMDRESELGEYVKELDKIREGFYKDICEHLTSLGD